jgi:hypothetical protein
VTDTYDRFSPLYEPDEDNPALRNMRPDTKINIKLEGKTHPKDQPVRNPLYKDIANQQRPKIFEIDLSISNDKNSKDKEISFKQTQNQPPLLPNTQKDHQTDKDHRFQGNKTQKQVETKEEKAARKKLEKELKQDQKRLKKDLKKQRKEEKKALKEQEKEVNKSDKETKQQKGGTDSNSDGLFDTISSIFGGVVNAVLSIHIFNRSKYDPENPNRLPKSALKIPHYPRYDPQSEVKNKNQPGEDDRNGRF